MATVLANGSLSSKTSGEGEIRRNLVESDLVECIVAMPEKLFFTTGISVCLWFLTKDKTERKVETERSQRKRKGEILFIDAREHGHMATRTVKELTDEDIARIADTYHVWRGEEAAADYADIPGFCASVSVETIRDHEHVLTPGRYVGNEEAEGDGEDLDTKIAKLTQEVRDGFNRRTLLQGAVLEALDSLEAAKHV
jgi:type I restriction enzyme M protein